MTLQYICTTIIILLSNYIFILLIKNVFILIIEYIEKKIKMVSNRKVMSMKKKQFDHAWNNKLFMDDYIGTTFYDKIEEFYTKIIYGNEYYKLNKIPLLLERQDSCDFHKDLYENRLKLKYMTMKQYWANTRCYKYMIAQLLLLFKNIKNIYNIENEFENNNYSNIQDIINDIYLFLNTDNNIFKNKYLELLFNNNLDEIIKKCLKIDENRNCALSFYELKNNIHLIYFVEKIIKLEYCSEIEKYFLRDNGTSFLYPSHFNIVEKDIIFPNSYKLLIMKSFEYWSLGRSLMLKVYLDKINSINELIKLNKMLLLPIISLIGNRKINITMINCILNYMYMDDITKDFIDNIDKYVIIKYK